MSFSSETATSEIPATKCVSENDDIACNYKESKVTLESIAANERELKGFLETLKNLLYEFQKQCTGDQEIFKVVECEEDTLCNNEAIERRAAALLQGARGSKEEILRQGLEILGEGEWQKHFEDEKLGTNQSYACEELRSLKTVTELDEELSALVKQHLPLWESNISLLPCMFSKMLLLLRKKRKLFEKRIITCISIIRRLSKATHQRNQTSSCKLDELKIKLKKLELDWNKHQKNELKAIEHIREKKTQQKEKEEQRMKRESEKRQKNAEREKQKMERFYRLQQRDDRKRIIQEERERKRMETEAEQQAVHRQAAVLENFIKNAPKLSPLQGINRRQLSISDELQRISKENSKQHYKDAMQDLIFSIKHTRKEIWKELGIKQVSFGQCRGHRVKLLQFEGSCRPPFHGIIQKPSKMPNGRNPYIHLPWLDYDYDSEMEWIESEPGESISESSTEDDESLLDTECNSSSDNDSFLIDDEQKLSEVGFEGFFPLQEELIGIISCHDSNDAQRVALSKFPRKQLLNVKITNNAARSSETPGEVLKNWEIDLNNRQDQVVEIKENLKRLEEFWQKTEKKDENLSKVHSKLTASVDISAGLLQTNILQEFHRYLLVLVQKGIQNHDLAYIRRQFLFLFFPITSLDVLRNMHPETPTMMVKTCLICQQEQEWIQLMASCLLRMMQTFQVNLEAISTTKIDELQSTEKLVEEFLSSNAFNTAVRKAFEILRDKIGIVIPK
ncbi:hypothetical protein GpartN1_g468.t1 [Galdieria partita]|uniref:Chromatin assembly factor 1 subunit A dimerization domain-containing protein n=1 Tax=Galdieria partita TaxID=83374 RepID=A0A9C7UMJ7_9RHOD|nr:hypothetical protein GpartN1_g468.t1 [Galdieria partita]